MTTIRDILALDQWPDLVVGPNGYAAKRRVDVAPLAYELKVNGPLCRDKIEEVVQFGSKADAGLIRDLFGLCNGIKVGATKFGVYGVLVKMDFGPDGVAGTLPFDINIPNLYGCPKGWPEEYLIVAEGTETQKNGRRENVIHAITDRKNIIVAKSNCHKTTLRTYSDVTEWLFVEVNRALKDTKYF